MLCFRDGHSGLERGDRHGPATGGGGGVLRGEFEHRRRANSRGLLRACGNIHSHAPRQSDRYNYANGYYSHSIHDARRISVPNRYRADPDPPPAAGPHLYAHPDQDAHTDPGADSNAHKNARSANSNTHPADCDEYGILAARCDKYGSASTNYDTNACDTSYKYSVISNTGSRQRHSPGIRRHSDSRGNSYAIAMSHLRG